MSTQIEHEVSRRRTFAIISHPDAGKTTMTEKLLLYGGAIRMAGSVKARRAAMHATSDWMEIEKQRGISVSSSVMQFEYNGYCINILDTPGHQDFSEDTYRTLMAADSAVMLIDGAKGVEPQTIKLFHVCRMRHIPIFTFINKMDRAAKNPIDLLAEIEDVLGIKSCPMNWPIGTDGDFKGIYNRQTSQIELYSGGDHGQTKVNIVSGNLNDESFTESIGTSYVNRLREEIELLDMAGDAFDLSLISKGELTPVFFGSAINNFGVETFLSAFLEYAPCPKEKLLSDRTLDPAKDSFSGFIFKIQANMDPAHRDRIAFLRICSGKFEKGMSVWQTRTGRKIKLAQPQQFMAQERNTAEEGYAGDIIGLFDPGIFEISDTLSENDSSLKFDVIPSFSPEIFARVYVSDSMKRKQFLKGMEQLTQEGAIQIFKEPNIGIEAFVVGAVGMLQLEVLDYRIKNEYNATPSFDHLPFHFARWIKSGQHPDSLRLSSTTRYVYDKNDNPVLLFENAWSINWALENNDGLELSEHAIL
ncbi:MAG: peptide chain release factor 3 [Clostridiales bacterium]|nr:peptide chain release factor 3 [Clostridiales bacterium]